MKAFDAYSSLLNSLHIEMVDGRELEPTTDALRDQMDRLWNAMGAHERARCEATAAALYADFARDLEHALR